MTREEFFNILSSGYVKDKKAPIEHIREAEYKQILFAKWLEKESHKIISKYKKLCGEGVIKIAFDDNVHHKVNVMEFDTNER